MRYRPLGRTGLTVSEVGMGCNRIGEHIHTDDHWVRLLQHAVNLGVTIFDTSEQYQNTRSEEMLGRAIGQREDVYIATKMAHKKDSDAGDFSAARMMTTVEDSLRRLRRDCIDIYQLHSPSREEMERYDWAEGMEKLRAQGKIRLRAVAIRTSDDGIWLMEQGLVDVMQITHNIFELADERMLTMAQEQGVGLLCRMPLARGILTGKFRPDRAVAGDHRATLQGQKLARQIEQAEALRSPGATYPGGMTRMAHHFSLRPDAISCVIPGARNVEQLAQNVAASDGNRLPGALYQQIMDIRAGWQAI